MQHRMAEPRTNALLDYLIRSIRSRRMPYALDKAVHAILRIGRCPREELALGALGVAHNFFDPMTPPSPTYRIEQVHEPGADKESARESR